MTYRQQMNVNENHKSFKGFITSLLADSLFEESFGPLCDEDLEICKIEDDTVFLHRFIKPATLN